MNRRGTRNADKERFWRNAIERQRASALSQQLFCERERLNPNTFCYWKQIIRERDAEMDAAKQGDGLRGAPVRQKAKEKKTTFAPVILTPTEPAATTSLSSIEVHFGRDRFVRVFEGTSSELLAAVFHALRLS